MALPCQGLRQYITYTPQTPSRFFGSISKSSEEFGTPSEIFRKSSGQLRKSSKVFGSTSLIFGRLQKSLDQLRKSSGVLWSISDVWKTSRLFRKTSCMESTIWD